LIRAGKYFLPCTYLVLLLVLPRNLLIFLARGLPLHYSRFIMLLWVFNILLAAAGAMAVMEAMGKLRSAWMRSAGLAVFVLLMEWALIAAGIQDYGPTLADSRYGQIFRLAERSCSGRDFPAPVQAVKDLPGYSDARQLMDRIAELRPTGRVAVETNSSNLSFLGTPHLFSTLLPWAYGIPVVPGLLAESSLSSGFLIPILGKGSRSIVWARDPGLGEIKLSDAIERLRLFNVEYLVASSFSYLSNLTAIADPLTCPPPSICQEPPCAPLCPNAAKPLVLMERLGTMGVFRLKDPRPFLESVKARPFLFIEQGGMDFRRFSEEWFKSSELLPYPIIFTKRPFAELPAKERERLGGVILSLDSKSPLEPAQYRYWQEQGLRVLALNAEPQLDMPETESFTYLSPLRIEITMLRLGQIFRRLYPNVAGHDSVAALRRSASEVEFDSRDGVIINYSYFPDWRSTDPDQTVFLSTPSLMFVFADGPTKLVYQPGNW
jgi:hypothetical protein